MRKNGMSNLIRRGTAAFLVTAMTLAQAFSAFPLRSYAATGDKLKDKYTGFEGVSIDWKYGSQTEGNYRDYISGYSESDYAKNDVSVSIDTAVDVNGNTLTVSDHEGRPAILADRSSEYVLFTVDVPAEGLYRLKLDYYLKSGSSDVGKRIVYIDGSAPFVECSDIKFPRFFKDAGEPVANSIGDESRPQQVTIDGWRSAFMEDTSGKYEEP
ncbi:MAG: hypothetical protein J6033_07405, partial [Lachnospiraceae bacterium]|nr:hypothetical protein [Lachnospiraceae bacterium]